MLEPAPCRAGSSKRTYYGCVSGAARGGAPGARAAHAPSAVPPATPAPPPQPAPWCEAAEQGRTRWVHRQRAMQGVRARCWVHESRRSAPSSLHHPRSRASLTPGAYLFVVEAQAGALLERDGLDGRRDALLVAPQPRACMASTARRQGAARASSASGAGWLQALLAACMAHAWGSGHSAAACPRAPASRRCGLPCSKQPLAPSTCCPKTCHHPCPDMLKACLRA